MSSCINIERLLETLLIEDIYWDFDGELYVNIQYSYEEGWQDGYSVPWQPQPDFPTYDVFEAFVKSNDARIKVGFVDGLQSLAVRDGWWKDYLYEQLGDLELDEALITQDILRDVVNPLLEELHEKANIGYYQI